MKQREADVSKRAERSKKRSAQRTDFTTYMTPIKEESKEMFLSSETHFFKKVKQHPERDLNDFTRVIDQPDPTITTGNMESFYNIGRKRLFSEALSESKSTSALKSKKKLSINNTVEVYYYAPCNYN